MDKLDIIDTNSKKMLDSSKSIRNFIAELVDENSFVETDVYMAGDNYIDGTEALGEGVVTGYAYITGEPVCIIAQNHEVLKGSISVCHAAKIEKTLDRAIKTGTAVISIINSNGARLGEGIAVLEGYSKIIRKANMLKGVAGHIAVVEGACVGLMSAYVNTCDFVYLNAKTGYISLTPPQVVIAKADKMTEPQIALGQESAKKSPIATYIYNSAKEVCNEIYKLFDLLFSDSEENDDDPNRLSAALNKSCDVTSLLKAVCDNGKYIELYSQYAAEIYTVIGSVNGITCGIIATDISRNDGYISKNGLIKINRFLDRLIDADMPLITLLDSYGIEGSLKEEQEGISLLASEVMSKIATFDNTKIAVIVKNAVGYAYSALCSKAIGFDYTLAFCDSYVSSLKADTAIEVLAVDEIKKAKDTKKARENLEKAYVKDAANPYITAKQGFIDNIIEPAVIRPYIISILNMLMSY